MADESHKTPSEGPVPDPHRHKPPPPADRLTRPEPGADVVRPDQQEDLGPVPELFGAAGAEARAYASDDPAIAREAIERGAEAEGLETAQIFGLLLATVVVLALIVVGVFVMVSVMGQQRDVFRQAALQYDELIEVRQTDRERLSTYRPIEGAPGVFTMPLERAQALMAAEARQRPSGPDAVEAPEARIDFNLAFPRASAQRVVPHPEMPAAAILGPGEPAGQPENETAQPDLPEPTPGQPPVQ
jgi:hypothetical protein